jgi:5'(3')-deoxyribonucleotidase
MDGVLVNLKNEIDNYIANNPDEYYRNNPDHIPGIFRNPPPIEGAIDAVWRLHNSGRYDLYIATAAPWGNPESNTDKRYWIGRHFGDLFYKKMFITHRKDLLIGNYLIDDRTKNGAKDFVGELLLFGEGNPYPDWNSILNKLL